MTLLKSKIEELAKIANIARKELPKSMNGIVLEGLNLKASSVVSLLQKEDLEDDPEGNVILILLCLTMAENLEISHKFFHEKEFLKKVMYIVHIMIDEEVGELDLIKYYYEAYPLTSYEEDNVISLEDYRIKNL